MAIATGLDVGAGGASRLYAEARQRGASHPVCRTAGPCLTALPLILSLATSPASAEFVCTTTATDATCINPAGGTASPNFINEPGGQNAITTNLGSAFGFAAFTLIGGNATATNSGSNTGDLIAATASGGNAIAINSGTNSGMIKAAVNSTGNATAINSGINIGGIEVTATSGNGTATNSGTNSGGMTAATRVGDATVTNSGTNSGGIGATVFTLGNAMVTNTGTNTGGILAISRSGNAAVFNSGTTDTAFSQTNNGNATLVNSGRITGLAEVFATGSGVLTNSGTISNPGGNAIELDGSGTDTLNVAPGSQIIGGIRLNAINNVINFLGGNYNLTFATGAGAAATVTGAIPFALSGNQAAAIDPTPFALTDKNLMDFTRGISGILGSLGAARPGASAGSAANAYAPSDTAAGRIDAAFASVPGLAYAGNDEALVFKAPAIVDNAGRTLWARGFAGERVQQAEGPDLHAISNYAGGAVGFDLLARPDLRLGVFAGGGDSRMSVDLNSGSTKSDMVFGGVYGHYAFTSFGAASLLDFALHGGGSHNTSLRNINNNLAPGGLESATASYNGWYVSPELGYAVHLPLWGGFTLTPSAHLRYVAGAFDSYTESGSTANLTVGSRTVQDIEERGELKLTHASVFGRDLLLTSVHVGVLGIERVGDTTVDAVLLGAGTPFLTPGKADVAGWLAGTGFEWRTREGISFFGAGEYLAMSDASTAWLAKGGMRVGF